MVYLFPTIFSNNLIFYLPFICKAFTFITRELAFYVMIYIYHNFRVTINLNIYYLRTKICSRKEGKMTGFKAPLIILFIEKMTSQALRLAVVNVWFGQSDRVFFVYSLIQMYCSFESHWKKRHQDLNSTPTRRGRRAYQTINLFTKSYLK